MMQNLSTVIFNDYDCTCANTKDRLRRILYDIYLALTEQTDITLALHPSPTPIPTPQQLAQNFVASIHQLRQTLYTDVHAIMHNDPAARSTHEVISTYPAIKALLHYRTAHKLLQAGIPILPRMITEMAHSATGIDIHPAAKIGEHFAIDHGTGIVIGETCIIGQHVTIYQGVTLGARNFEYDQEGNPLNVPRHPIIEDNVTIYSNTSILGRITVGHNTIVGGNVWLTQTVPPYSRIIQGKTLNENKN